MHRERGLFCWLLGSVFAGIAANLVQNNERLLAMMRAILRNRTCTYNEHTYKQRDQLPCPRAAAAVKAKKQQLWWLTKEELCNGTALVLGHDDGSCVQRLAALADGLSNAVVVRQEVHNLAARVEKGGLQWQDGLQLSRPAVPAQVTNKPQLQPATRQPQKQACQPNPTGPIHSHFVGNVAARQLGDKPALHEFLGLCNLQSKDEEATL